MVKCRAVKWHWAIAATTGLGYVINKAVMSEQGGLINVRGS